MQLIDLVLQGVRRFVQSQKIPFKPGFNIIFGGTEAGKTTLYECILDLLFPNRIIEEKLVWQSWSGAEQSRAGLTLKKEEQVYRILKDFAANRMSLSRKAPNAEKYERLSTEPSEIASILAEEFGLIGWEDYKTLFLESNLYLPSNIGSSKFDKRPEAGDAQPVPQDRPEQFQAMQMQSPGFPGQGQELGGGFGFMPGMGGPGMMPGMPGAPGFGMPGMPGMPGMGMPGMPGMGMPGGEMLDPGDGMSWEEKEKKLEKLKSEMVQHKEVEEIQFEIGGLEGKVFELQKEKEKIKKFDAEIKKLDAELDKYRFFKNMPDNIEQRIDQYDSSQENRGRDLDALDQKLADMDDEIRFLGSQPKFWQVNLFKGGAGAMAGGVVLMALGGVLGLPKSLQPLFGIVIVGGLIVLGYILWQYMSRITKISELKAALAKTEEQRRTTAKDYDVKGAMVKKLLEQVKVDQTTDLKEMLHTFIGLETSRNELNKKKKELMVAMDIEKINREEAELKVQIAELDGKLKKYGGMGLDSNETRREIEQLEYALNRARQLGLIGQKRPDIPIGQPAPRIADAFTTAPPMDAGKTQMSSQAQRMQLPFWEKILESSGRLLGLSADEMYKQVSDRANLYLQAFSGKRYQEFRKDGDLIQVRFADMGQEVELKQLGKSGMDIVYLALKLVVLEMLVSKYQFPVLIDEPYLNMDETRTASIAKTLKRLSQKTQVVNFTSQKIFVREADNALSLG